jgi:hypothetical protein
MTPLLFHQHLVSNLVPDAAVSYGMLRASRKSPCKAGLNREVYILRNRACDLQDCEGIHRCYHETHDIAARVEQRASTVTGLSGRADLQEKLRSLGDVSSRDRN